MIPPMPKGGYLNAGDVDMLPISGQILKIIGEGHPDKIIKMAFECDHEGIKKLQSAASAIIEEHKHQLKIVSHEVQTLTSQHDRTDSHRGSHGRSGEVAPDARHQSEHEQRSSTASLPNIPLSVGESIAFSNASVFGNTVFAPVPAKSEGLINPFEYYEIDVTESFAVSAPASGHVGTTVLGVTQLSISSSNAPQSAAKK